MKKIIRIRGWASIPESVEYISEVLEEEIKAEDLYRLALNGKVTLSVDFIEKADALHGDIDLKNENLFKLISMQVNFEELLCKFFKKEIVSWYGLYDLPVFEIKGEPVIGAGIVYKENNAFVLLPPFNYINGNVQKFISLNFQEVNMDTDKIINYKEGYFPVKFPEEFRIVIKANELDKFGKQIKPEISKNNLIENPKSIESLIKIVITMAIDGYGYDPCQKKSSLPSELVKHAELLGISINADTVRKWLKEGSNYLDRKKE